MKYFISFLIIILQINLVFAHQDYCGFYTGEMERICEKKRAKAIYGNQAENIEKQVDNLSNLLKKAMLSRQYESLESYIQFPFEFTVTDYKCTELTNDAKGYSKKATNFKEFHNFLIKMNKHHPDVFVDLRSGEYSRLYINDIYIYLIIGEHTFSLAVKDSTVKIIDLLIRIY